MTTDPALDTIAAVLGATPLEASPAWRIPTPLPGTDLVWGRGPDDSLGALAAARSLAARWTAIASLRLRARRLHRSVQVHRIPARNLGGRRGALRSALRSGAAVELRTPGSPSDQPLDEIARQAGTARRPGALRVRSGGVVTAEVPAHGAPALLRIAGGESGAALTRARAALVALEDLRSPLIPRSLGGGEVGGLTWTLESKLPGQRPAALDDRLVADVSTFLAGLVGRGDRRRVTDDVAALATDGHQLDTLAAPVDEVLDELPSVVRHGDLWLGNLLVGRGRLTGVVDWDAARGSAAPGTDLLHLIATDHRMRHRCSLGEVWAKQPWTWPAFRGAEYWRLLGCTPTPEQERAIGVAWWAAQVSADVTRDRRLLDDPGWRANNVDRVVATLAGCR